MFELKDSNPRPGRIKLALVLKTASQLTLQTSGTQARFDMKRPMHEFPPGQQMVFNCQQALYQKTKGE
jgi:hypothetical protein